MRQHIYGFCKSDSTSQSAINSQKSISVVFVYHLCPGYQKKSLFNCGVGKNRNKQMERPENRDDIIIRISVIGDI